MTTCRSAPRVRVAVLTAATLAIAACAALGRPGSHGPGLSPLLPLPVRVATASRETTLDGGAIVVESVAPLHPPGARPAVIGPPALRDAVLGAGAVAVWYTIDWSRFGIAADLQVAENAAAGQPPLQAESPSMLGETFFHRVAIAADAVLPRVLDWMETLPEVDLERIALVGMGPEGFVALTATAHDHRVAAVASLFACGDFVRFVHESPCGAAGSPLELDPGYAAWLHSLSPLANPIRLLPAPILLATRQDDSLVPASCVEATARQLRALYEAAGIPERIEHVRLAAEDNGLEAAIAWLKRWILAG